MSCKPGSPDPASWIYVVVYKSPANGGAGFETRTVPRRNPPPVQSNSTIQAHQAGVEVGHRRWDARPVVKVPLPVTIVCQRL